MLPESDTRDHFPAPADNIGAHAWLMPFFGVALALNVLKGVRMPNRWAVTHYLFTYQHGFIKRGLWGDILRRVLGAWTAHYLVLGVIGLVVLAATIALLVYECRALPAGPVRVPLMLVLSSTPAIAFAAHLAGYLEQIGYLLLAVTMWQQRRWRIRVWLAIVAAVVLPFVHEASILWVGALTCLAVLVGAREEPQPVRVRARASALVAALWIASTLTVIEFGRVSVERADQLRSERTAFFEVRPRQDAFHTLTVSFAAAAEDMRVRWSDPDVRIDMAFSLLVFGPATIFLGVLAARQIRSRGGSSALARATTALVVIGIAGPQLLHVIGWDRHRWNALSCLNAGLAAIVLYRARAETVVRALEAPKKPSRLLAVSLAVCLWGASSDLVLFDRYVPTHPPFVDQVLFVIDAIRHPSAAKWIPDY